jgi:rhamnosyltransferase
MKRIAAVVAHFGEDGAVAPPFARLLRNIAAVAEHTIVVSTSRLPQEGILRSSSITTIERPNIGYDFYSYRVGLTELSDIAQYDGILLINSSFVVIDDMLFSSTLRDAITRGSESRAIGIVESEQIHRHLQSFLIYLHRNITTSEWFCSWRDSIEPRNCKQDVIVDYEVGLSSLLSSHGVALIPLINLSSAERLRAAASALRSKFATKPLPRALASMISGRFRMFNPTHVAAQRIARQCGIVKIELLLSNPLKLDLSWLPKCMTPEVQREVAHFIQQRRAAHPSAALRLVTTAPRAALRKQGVAVVAHVFYSDLLDQLRESLLNVVEPFNLYITTPHEADVPHILERLADVTPYLAISITENRGRDIGPFVSLLRTGMLDQYQAVLKVHLKKSGYSARGAEWRDLLFTELCGDARIVTRSLEIIRAGQVGILGPHSQFLTHPRFWGRNERMVREIQKASGLSSSNPLPLGFFAGSMFWFNPRALRAISALPESLVRFEAESGDHDGTRAHAFERVFTTLAHQAGYRVSSLVLAGKEIAGRAENESHTVPVL